MKLVQLFVFYIGLFAIFYFEPTQIGSFTFSQLWKIPLMLYLISFIIIRRIKDRPAFGKVAYWRSIKNLYTSDMSINFIPQFFDFIRYLMFPLMLDYFKMKFKQEEQLKRMLFHYSNFVILSGLPFTLHLLTSKGDILSISQDVNSYIGIFQGAHSASITTSSALVVLIYLIRKKLTSKLTRTYCYALVFYGSYLLFLTYVRTGYLMFVFGFCAMILPKKVNLSQLFLLFSILIAMFFGFEYLLEHNQVLYDRIYDIRNGNEMEAGSGRLIFWESAFHLWYSGSFSVLFFGAGYVGLTEYLFSITGLKIYAHNEFFTQLAQNGIIGLGLFFLFLYQLFLYIRKRKNSTYYRLAMVVFVMYISMMMTQGGVWFPLDIFLVLIFVQLDVTNYS